MSNDISTIQLDYALVDVFAEAPFEGNQLAIFTDGRGLSDAQMQTLARETNLSETTFILPGDPEEEARDGVRVRIFTTDEELPFAGHPTLGTASWLHLHHPVLRGAETLRLKLNVGPIEVRFTPEDGRAGVYATMRQPNPVFGQEHDREAVAKVLGLPLEALDERFPVQTVSTGVPFCVVPVRSVEALGGLETNRAESTRYLGKSDAKFFYCLAPADRAADGFRARMQFYTGEDPATGSAAGCAAAWLVQHGRVPAGESTVIRQGVEMLRPSYLTVEAGWEDGRVSNVFVSGRTIPVAMGRFLLPIRPSFPQQEDHATATNWGR